MKKRSPILERSFKEVFNNPPKIVRSTKRKFGAKRALAQSRAIAFSKARGAGARV